VTLGDKQKIFAFLVSKLIQKAYCMGYEITLGEAWRPRATAEYYAKKGIGIKNSLHTKRLAIDINLFKNGKYLTSTKAHKPLGEWWEKQGKKYKVNTVWGGRFGDGTHHSVEFKGVK